VRIESVDFEKDSFALKNGKKRNKCIKKGDMGSSPLN